MLPHNINVTCTAMILLCSQFNNLLKWSTVSDGLPIHGEGPTGSQTNEEPTTTTTTQSWYRRPLASFTFYVELSVARTPEEFASVRTRLQEEWSFDGGFVSRLQSCFLSTSSLICIAYCPCCVRVFVTTRWQMVCSKQINAQRQCSNVCNNC